MSTSDSKGRTSMAKYSSRQNFTKTTLYIDNKITLLLRGNHRTVGLTLYFQSHLKVPYDGLIFSRDEDPDPDPVIFGPPDPDPVIFSTDPDPTCNNGYMKLFLS